MPFRICTLNRADFATLDFVTDAGTMAAPITNLQNSWRARPARTQAGDSALEIQVDLGASYPISDIVLWRHNLTAAEAEAASVTLYSGANLGGSVVPVSGAGQTNHSYAARPDVPGYSWLAIQFDPATCRSLKINLERAAGYVEVNRLFVGAAVEFDTPQDWQSALLRKNDGRSERTEGGSIVAPPPRIPSYRELTIPFSFLTQAERALLLEAGAANQGADMWISAYAGHGGQDERDYSMIGRMISQQGADPKPYLLFGDRLVIQEI